MKLPQVDPVDFSEGAGDMDRRGAFVDADLLHIDGDQRFILDNQDVCACKRLI